MPPKAPTNAQEASIIFQRYRTELQNLAQKIGELESEMDEYSCVPSGAFLLLLPIWYPFYDSLVLSTLSPLKSSEPSRTCYRLIGGTLVKRSVQDVVPTLETTHSGIKEVLDSLVKSYQEKEKEFDAWRKEAGVQVSISTSVYCPTKVIQKTGRMLMNLVDA